MAHKLTPYRGIIAARLEEFPELSVKRLFDETRAACYRGGYSRVRDYVRAVHPRPRRFFARKRPARESASGGDVHEICSNDENQCPDRPAGLASLRLGDAAADVQES